MKNIAACTKLFCFLVFLGACSSCAFRSVSRHKNISYLTQDLTRSGSQQKLNIFSPKKRASPRSVLVFIHGGSWRSGNKNLYSFFGNRLARKGVVSVIISYPLSPEADYNDMARACARAVKWVSENIKPYGGDPDKIFISGHSAGGHLAALISVRDEYFDSLDIKSPIKGAILIDAAGLDMYGYLKEDKKPPGHSYLNTFTTNERSWKDASPLYHLHARMPPMLIYRGERTYPSIEKSNEKFVAALKPYVSSINYKVLKRKKHIPMITQLFWTWNPLYDEIMDFMNK
jgi:acetyl esterase/lipase